VRLAAAQRVELGLDVRQLFRVRHLAGVQPALLVLDLVVDLLDLGFKLGLIARDRIEARLRFGVGDGDPRSLLVQLVELTLLGKVCLPLIEAVYPAIDPLEIQERTHRLTRDAFHSCGSPCFQLRRAQISSGTTYPRVALPSATARLYRLSR